MNRSEQYAKGLAQMIRWETVDGQDEVVFAACRETLRTLFPHVFAKCRTEDFDGSLLLCWQGQAHTAPILLMNHYDVVQAGEGWSHDPFSAESSDGRLWGRGALDDKGGLYCMLQAAEELIAEGFVPPQDVYFVSTRTEETGGSGADAISRALQQRGLRFAFSLDEGGMILYDPIGGADGKFAMIAMGEKGCADLRFVARSGGGHASRPGKNTPLVRLGKFMCDMERHGHFHVALSDTVCEMLRAMAPDMKQPLRFLLGHPVWFGGLLRLVLPKVSSNAASMMATTLAFTMAKGSEGTNVLPQEAYVVGNMRYSHHQGFEDSVNLIRKRTKKYGIEIEVMDRGMLGKIADTNSEAYKRLSRALERVFPDVKPAPYIAASASDNRFMSRVTDNCFGFTPFFISDAQLSGIHGVDESVDISCLGPAVDFYKEIIRGGR